MPHLQVRRAPGAVVAEMGMTALATSPPVSTMHRSNLISRVSLAEFSFAD